MHMNEFEEGPSPSSGFDEDDPSASHGEFPDDFSPEDIAFAEELHALFALEQEEMPPFFVQTLMDTEDPRLQPVEDGFEKKISARVFRRLNLQRRLFSSSCFPARSLQTAWTLPPVTRSFVAIATACLLLMLVTVIMSGPAFAAGWNYLWSGPHSGVMQVNNYPAVPTPAPDPIPSESAHDHQISIYEAQSRLHFPLYWPQAIPDRYTQRAIYLYPGDQSWADGPVVVLTFTYLPEGKAPRQITICEFKPEGKVLQVVQSGAAQRIKIGQDGSAGIYVEGQWKDPDGTKYPVWIYSDRSELIYERNETGTVFWIVGDRRDGMDGAALEDIALSLHAFKVQADETHMGERLERVIQAVNGMPWPFANDVIYLDDPDNPAGPSFTLVHANSYHHTFPHML